MDILAKVIVIYESKYGNTELVAENVIKDMRGELKEYKLSLLSLKKLT